MTDKEKLERFAHDVAHMLIEFMTYTNKDHGVYLLREWDKIREHYDQ